MLISNQHLLKARVGTGIGSIFLLSWALGAGLVIWNLSSGQNPVENALTAALYGKNAELQPYLTNTNF
jgi:hypothetical protein